MFKKGILLLGIVGFGLGSCIEHEVIPPPEQVVELYCDFEGLIGGANILYTENVEGYECTPSISKQSNTMTGITSAQYIFAMTSQSQATSIRIAMGSLSWNDPTGTETPSLSLFNSFFQTNDMPNYSTGALNGFEVSYRDQYGDVWRSYTPGTEPTPESGTPTATIEVSFDPASIIQESDKNGDYSKFTCYFTCPVYHTYSVVDLSVNPQTNPPTMRDSVSVLNIEDAVYKGYFRR